jgi:uncharacterized membrane protein
MDTDADESEARPGPTMGDLLDDLEALEASVDDEAEREQVKDVMRTASAVRPRDGFGQVIVGFDRADVSEAILGAFLFGVPMFVEGGTQEVGTYLATRPLVLVGTICFGVAMVYGILYVAEIQDVRVLDPLWGILPRRFVGVLFISLALATLLMTAWGRVSWASPVRATAQIVVAFVPMAIGASLGDILPGS